MNDILFLDDLIHYDHMPAVVDQLVRLKGRLVALMPQDIAPAHHPDIIAMVSAGAALPEEITTLANAGKFYAASEKAGQLAALARPEQYDLVIVGNNMGEGLTLVRMLTLELRGKTTVMAFDPLSTDQEAPYRELGCTQFMRRDDLYTVLAALEPT